MQQNTSDIVETILKYYRDLSTEDCVAEFENKPILTASLHRMTASHPGGHSGKK